MSKIRSSVIEPATGTTLTLGASGDTVAVSSDAIKLNTLKDSGGNTLFTSNGSGTLSSVNSSFSGAGPKLIQSQTADGDSTVSFTSGIDSTYDKYMFVFVNIHPSYNGARFRFQMNASGGSGYNETMTTTFFNAFHAEGGGVDYGLSYLTANDQAQGTAFQDLTREIGNDADQSGSGELYLFSPSSTTYVKQFYCRSHNSYHADYSIDNFVAGYFNTTSALTEIQFKMESGNIDTGTIKLYGVS